MRSRGVIAFASLFLAAGVWVVVRGAARLEVGGFRRVALGPGIELVEVELRRGQDPGGRWVAIYAEPGKLRPAIVLNPAHASLASLAPDALLVMNAGFFTADWRPTGLLVSQGKLLSRFVKHAGSGVLVIEDGKIALLERDRIGDARSWSNAALAIQAGPRLIENGERPGIRSDDGARAHRTVIGGDRRGRLVAGVVRGPGAWTSGPTLHELMDLLGKRGLGAGPEPDLALAFALNLDGGPSTGLHLRHPDRRVNLPEAAPVESALVLEVQ